MIHERTYFRAKIGWLAPVVGLLLAGVFLLSPAPIFSGRSLPVTALESRAREGVFDAVRIYSLLKAHKPELHELRAWNIARSIDRESRKRSLDPMLILAIIKVESHFRTFAVSPKGARGLMQILPFVAGSLAEEVNLDPARVLKNLDDPVVNIRVGVSYFANLKKEFKDTRLALSAYNAGPTEIRKRLRGKRPLPRRYSSKVIETYRFFNRISPRNRPRLPRMIRRFPNNLSPVFNVRK